MGARGPQGGCTGTPGWVHEPQWDAGSRTDPRAISPDDRVAGAAKDVAHNMETRSHGALLGLAGPDVGDRVEEVSLRGNDTSEICKG